MNPKGIINKYLEDEGISLEEINNAKFNFGYKFAYPPSGRGQMITLVNPKEKDYILLLTGVQIPNQYIKIINKFNDAKKYKLFNDLKKIFIVKNYFFKLDIQKYRFEISDQLFFKADGKSSKNTLFQGLRRLYGCILYSKIVIEEYCRINMKLESQESINFDFSLYS